MSSITFLSAGLVALFESVQNDVCCLDYGIFQADEDKRVSTGPFRGMRLFPETRWRDGNLCLKMFGYYEHELHSAIEKAIARQPTTVINIGCGEGYYTVGMAMRLPQATVYGTDISSEALRICREAAGLNSVSQRVNVGLVVDGDMTITITKPCLLIIDIEGDEERVIENQKGLETFDIIVECHDFIQPGISSRISGILSSTHDIEKIEPRLVFPANPYGWQSMLLQSVIMTEKRSLPSCWLACWPKE